MPCGSGNGCKATSCKRTWPIGSASSGAIPPLLELPTDRPRPAVQTFAGDYRSFTLPEELSRDVQALSRREGATLFMTLLAAFQVLLGRYSGEAGAPAKAGTPAQDICVGTPIANRTQSELEPLIGFFVNTLVLRGDLSGDPTFRQLLQRTREAALGAYAHQDLPFEMIVDKVQPQRDMGHSPLFQVMFVLRNAGSTVHGSSGARAASSPGAGAPACASLPSRPTAAPAKFDLTLFVVDEEDRLSGALEYNTDLFDAATIAHCSITGSNLLQGIVAHPDEHISRLPLMGRHELGKLLVEWNDTAYPYPAVCAHQLFEAQAARTPDAVAVTVAADPLTGRPQRSLTYRELNRRANQLARYLQSQGVGPDVLVGVCARRTLELPVALLGDPQGGRCLRAARSDLSPGAAGLYAGRACRHESCRHDMTPRRRAHPAHPDRACWGSYRSAPGCAQPRRLPGRGLAGYGPAGSTRLAARFDAPPDSVLRLVVRRGIVR